MSTRISSILVVLFVLAAASLVAGCSDDDELPSRQDGGTDAGTDAGVDCTLCNETSPAPELGLDASPDQEADTSPDKGTAADMASDQQADSSPDKGTGADMAPDAAASDATPTDAAPAKCSPSATLSPLSLASAYCVVYRFNITSLTSPAPRAFNFDGDTFYLFTSAAGTSLKGAVSQGTIEPKTGKHTGTLTPVFSFTAGLTGFAFPGAYLALSPKPYAAVGYTVSGSAGGEVYWGDKGASTPNKVAGANGNSDLVFLDDSTMLINGTAVGSVSSGSGVYLVPTSGAPRQVIKGLGTYPGFLALGQNTLFASGFTKTNNVYAFTLAEVKASITSGTTLTASTDGDLVYSGDLTDAATLGDDLALLKKDIYLQFKSVTLLPVTITGSAVSKGAALGLITAGGSTGTTINGLAGAATRLGLLVGTSSTYELAFITKK